MITTAVFNQNLKAFNDGYRVIANEGGSRSSKTFSILQLLYSIESLSNKRLITSTVSHSLPHLTGGAIRDFDNILEEEGVNISRVKTKNPHIYRIGRSQHEFIGFDKPGKSLGAARDILHVNEANKMDFSIVHQLIQRTRIAVFLDWNPSEEFWFDEKGLRERSDVKVIHSTFLDNITNLTHGQISEFEYGKKRADEEASLGQKGYWWNWWQIYGLGLPGQFDEIIFKNWKIYNELPEDNYYRLYVSDDGYTVDPYTLLELNVNKKKRQIYIKELVYSQGLLTDDIISYLNKIMPGHEHEIVVDCAASRLIGELERAGFIVYKSIKGAGSVIEGIQVMQKWDLFIFSESISTINEFKKYKRQERNGVFIPTPIDKFNHSIDAIRYGVSWVEASFL